MNTHTRFAGTMEFSGINHQIDSSRVRAIAKGVKKFYPEITIQEEAINNAQCGLRPVSADGLPYIGRINNYNNLVVATGHAMMGWSLGPATGKLVSELICNEKTSISLSPFNPNRKF